MRAPAPVEEEKDKLEGSSEEGVGSTEDATSSEETTPEAPRAISTSSRVRGEPVDAAGAPPRGPRDSRSQHHPMRRPTIAETAAAQSADSKKPRDVSRPRKANPNPPRTMQHGDGIEGIKSYPGMAGAEGLGVGLACLSEENSAQNLGNGVHQMFEEMPQRTPSTGTAGLGPWMEEGQSMNAPPGSALAKAFSHTRSLSSTSTAHADLPAQRSAAETLPAEAAVATCLLEAPPCVGEIDETHTPLIRALEAVGAAVASLDGSIGIIITTEDGRRQVFHSRSHYHHGGWQEIGLSWNVLVSAETIVRLHDSFD